MLMKKMTRRRWMMRMVRLTKKEEDEDDVRCSRARGTCHPIERGRECKVISIKIFAFLFLLHVYPNANEWKWYDCL